MRNILVASDMSDRSDLAVRRGIELAISLGANLTICHVVDTAESADDAAQLESEAVSSIEASIDQWLDCRELNSMIAVEFGEVATNIEQVAKKTNADLLVIGVHRKRVFLDQYRETTMEKLVRSSRASILMVVTPNIRDYAHILGAVGLSRNCAAAIKIGHEIAPEAKVSLFHAHEVSFRKEAELDFIDWKTGTSLPVSLPDPIFVEASAADAVHELTTRGDYDLMTIGANTSPGVSQLFLGGLTASLIRNPPCDILVAK